MSRDGYMPPGATEHQRREHYDGPRVFRCVGCMKDKLAEEVVAAQRQTSQALEQTAAELAELRARTAEVERMLKEVG